MRLLELLRMRRADGNAVLAANFYNLETLQGVVAAAAAERQPLILQTSPATLRYIGVGPALALARAVAKEAGIEAFLHLDHCSDLDLLRTCVTAGWDSVMLDASDRPYAENLAAVQAAAAIAHPAGVVLEAELGAVPKLGEQQSGAALTDPEQAEAFVAASGADLLAPAIGSAHGFYASAPKLDLARLAAIASRVPVPLVLHGGSGLSDDDWRACIERGVAKVNFATEIKDAFVNRLRQELASGTDIDLRRICPPARDQVTRLVAGRIAVCTRIRNSA